MRGLVVGHGDVVVKGVDVGDVGGYWFRGNVLYGRCCRNLYEWRRTGRRKIAWFEFNGSRERDCLVPIGDEDFGFRGNAVAGEHANQIVAGKGRNTRGADQVG